MGPAAAHEDEGSSHEDGLKPPRRRNTVSSIPSRPPSATGRREELTNRPMSECIPPQGPRLSLVLPDGFGGEPRIIENVVADSYANELARDALRNYVPHSTPRGDGHRDSVFTIQVPERLQQRTEIVPMTFLRPKTNVHQSTYSIGSSSQVTDSGECDLPSERKPLETGLTHHPYPLRRFRFRAIANIIFPTFLVAFYGYILFAHVRLEPTNNIIPENHAGKTSNPRTTFYTWFIVCVFALDASKSGVAGLEAGAMMKRFVSPASAMQTLWHADRSWSNVSGWLRSFMIVMSPVLRLFSPRFRKPRTSRVPTLLWWYLASNSLILFMAIPLSGIAIELTTVKKYVNKPAVVAGASNSSFDSASLIITADKISRNWMERTISRRDGVASLYFSNPPSHDSKDALILEDYFTNISVVGPEVQAFAAPFSEKDVWGKAWGIFANISCNRVKFEDLKLIDKSAFKADFKMEMAADNQRWPGLRKENAVSSMGPIREISENSYEYNLDQRVVWNVSKVVSRNTIDEYDINFKDSPPPRIFEIGIWQNVSYTLDGADRDKINLPSLLNTMVKSLVSPEYYPKGAANPTGVITHFGISCTVHSYLGTARISPGPRTFKTVERIGLKRAPDILSQNNSLSTIETIAYKVLANTQHRAKSIATSVGYEPREIVVNGTDKQIIYPLLQPQDVQQSMYRLLGQAAVESMGRRDYHSNSRVIPQQDLKQLDPDAAAVVRGRPLHRRLAFLSAEFAFGLLVVWAWMTIIPGIYFSFSPRWAATLNGFEMYKFGIESVGAPDAQRFTGEDFWECDELAEIEAQWWRKRQ